MALIIKSMLFGTKYVFSSNICKYLVSNETNRNNLQPLKVISRSSETQLQVGDFF